MILITGLDHVQVEAPPGCEAAARAFYGDVLGLPELDKPAALHKNGGVWFGLPDNRQLHVGVVADFTPRTKGHPALRTANLADVQARLQACGLSSRLDTEAGVARIFLADPFGNRLEIVEGGHPARPGENAP